MPAVRRRQGTRSATERRALASELPVAECALRIDAITQAETGETDEREWPPPEGKRVFGWVSADGFMISPLRRHERLSLDLAWGGWSEQDGLTLVAVELLSLKTSRPLLLLLPVVGFVTFLGFSLLAGQLLLTNLQLLLLGSVVGLLVLGVMLIDEQRSIDDHRRLFALLLETLEAVEVPRASLPPEAQLLPPAPERPSPPGPVAWRR